MHVQGIVSYFIWLITIIDWACDMLYYGGSDHEYGIMFYVKCDSTHFDELALCEIVGSAG